MNPGIPPVSQAVASDIYAPHRAFINQSNNAISQITGHPSNVGVQPTGNGSSTNQAANRPTGSSAAVNDLRDSLLGKVDDVIDSKAKELGVDLSADMTRVEKVAAVLKQLGDGEEANAFKRDLATALGPLGHSINLGVKDLASFAPDRARTQSGYSDSVLKEVADLISRDKTHWAGATSSTSNSNSGRGSNEQTLRDLRTPVVASSNSAVRA